MMKEQIKGAGMATQRARTTTARERARAAQALLRAKDRDREVTIEEAQLSWFTAAEGIEEVAAALAGLRTEQVAAVAAMLGVGESVDRVAQLCDTDATTVRSLQREHTKMVKATDSNTGETA